VLRLATGAIDTLHRADGTPVPGTTPRWSPVSDVIAYTNPQPGWQNENANTIWLMDPDGSHQRAVSRPEHVYRPLAFTKSFVQPTWRP